MKWANHRLVTGVLVYAGTGNFLYAACSVIGSVLPDRLEGRPPKEKKAYWKWRSKHRKNTHWMLPYVVILAFLMYFQESGILTDFWQDILMLPFFVIVGAILHILEDSICGKIPLFTRKKNFGIRLFKVGSAWEYFISYTICLLALYYKFMM